MLLYESFVASWQVLRKILGGGGGNYPPPCTSEGQVMAFSTLVRLLKIAVVPLLLIRDIVEYDLYLTTYSKLENALGVRRAIRISEFK